MSDRSTTRRSLLRTTGAATVGLLAGAASVGAATDRSSDPDASSDGDAVEHRSTSPRSSSPPDDGGASSADDPDCDTEPPVPVYSISPADTFDDGYVVRAGERVTLDASNAFDPDGEVVEYEWSLTYGRKYGERVEHGWRAPGGKDVTLTVTDDDGATATAEIYVYVRGRY